MKPTARVSPSQWNKTSSQTSHRWYTRSIKYLQRWYRHWWKPTSVLCPYLLTAKWSRYLTQSTLDNTRVHTYIQTLRLGYTSLQGMDYMHLDYSHTHYTILQNTMRWMLDNLLRDLHPKRPRNLVLQRFDPFPTSTTAIV